MPGFVPNHQPDCETNTKPSRCRYCGKRIFYFTCTCGSMVLFDRLGFPWPEHNCLERHYEERAARRDARAGQVVIPNIEFLEVNAEVRDINWDVNFFDILDYPENPLSRAFLEESLGTLITEQQVGVDIEVIERVENRLRRVDRFFMPLEIAERMRLRIGMRIWVALFLLVIRLPGRPYPIWVMSDIKEL